MFVRWIALIVLLLAVLLIIVRLKFPPTRDTRSESTMKWLRQLWRALRERRRDALDRSDDLRALAGRRALLIDPDEKSARVMAWKLDSLKCVVTRARTGTQGLSAAGQGEFDLLIVDALLPDTSAADLYASLAITTKPIVFVGVLASQYDELRALGRNVACLGKPYDPEEAAAVAGYMIQREDHPA